MTIYKDPEIMDRAVERAKTSVFVQRVKHAKLDLPASNDLISGLFEDSQWKFVCADHVPSRFVDEKELKKHFEVEVHKGRRHSYNL
ncbi:MAG: hypothetical protein ACHQ1H_08665 [Nitrososphaerales archaeon]